MAAISAQLIHNDNLNTVRQLVRCHGCVDMA
jgi:hypothetical protein